MPVTFGNIKLHLPSGLQMCYTVKVMSGHVVMASHAVNECTLCIDANRRTEDLILSGRSFIKIRPIKG